MKNSLIFFLIFFYLISSLTTFSQVTVEGITIGDPIEALDTIKLEKINSDVDENDVTYTSFNTRNNNYLSITTMGDKIVYIENDWPNESSGKQPVFTDFIFGETTLFDIVDFFGEEGFSYKGAEIVIQDTEVLFLNCFEINKGVILAIVTSAHLPINQTQEHYYKEFKLKGVILSDRKYLGEIWGTEIEIIKSKK